MEATNDADRKITKRQVSRIPTVVASGRLENITRTVNDGLERSVAP